MTSQMSTIPVTLVERLERHLRRTPKFGAGVFVASGAVVIGDVELGDRSSVWYNAVLRGDINRILVGRCTNIQDGAILHLAEELPCVVGDYVTIGHAAVVHACTVGDETLIGMGAAILDGAVIGRRCLVGARALVTQNTEIPDGSLVLGCPARVVRPLTEPEQVSLRISAERYVETAAFYLGLHEAVTNRAPVQDKS